MQLLQEDTFCGHVRDSFSYDGTNGVIWIHGSSSPCADPDSDLWAQGDTIGVGIDASYGFVAFFINGRCVSISVIEQSARWADHARRFSTCEGCF